MTRFGTRDRDAAIARAPCARIGNVLVPGADKKSRSPRIFIRSDGSPHPAVGVTATRGPLASVVLATAVIPAVVVMPIVVPVIVMLPAMLPLVVMVPMMAVPMIAVPPVGAIPVRFLRQARASTVKRAFAHRKRCGLNG
jgi:hypothetical protein